MSLDNFYPDPFAELDTEEDEEEESIAKRVYDAIEEARAEIDHFRSHKP